MSLITTVCIAGAGAAAGAAGAGAGGAGAGDAAADCTGSLQLPPADGGRDEYIALLVGDHLD